VPCVYFTDYYAPGNLRYVINGLMEAHTRYIYGASQVDYLSRFSSPYFANYLSAGANTSLIYQTSYAESGKEVVVAINFSGNTLKVDQTINTANIFPGDTLTDIFGITAYDYIIVQDDNQVYLEIPPRSFAVFVEGDLRSELIDISTPVAIENTSTINNFQVYPNPAGDEIEFLIPQLISGDITLEITDISGKLILRDKRPATTNNINISTFSPGTYIIKIIHNNSIYISKFIKN
ncbi:MAG: DUF1939 domain-containing protein, partial [Chitinophagales bacterium]|nr:DUF1939 domain-containing protein [Chitinophagales bacterium]